MAAEVDLLYPLILGPFVVDIYRLWFKSVHFPVSQGNPARIVRKA